MNFRLAAEACFVTQPTLSAAIKEMEMVLGVPVLDRTNRKKIIFTPFGKAVLKTADKILPEMDYLIANAQRLAEPLSGSMRLGVIPTIAPYMLPQILPPLQNQFPKMEFQITENLSARLIEKLHTGDIDMALMAFPYNIEGLEEEFLFKENFYCACLKNTFSDKKISVQQLSDHHLLLLEDGHCLRDHALESCKLQQPVDQKMLSATSLQTILQMVSQGYGITLLPEMVINTETIPKNIQILPFKSPAPTRKIGLAWRKNSPQQDNIKAVIKEIENLNADI